MAIGAVVSTPAMAHAQQAAQGFNVERFYPSAAGGGWFVMDDLTFGGGLGGAAEWTTGYAKDPLRVTDGVRHLAVVSDETFTDVGLSGAYDRFRVYVNFTAPLSIQGNDGVVGAYSFAGPSVDLGSNPDTLSDPRIGFDTRLYGKPMDPFRAGIGFQLYVPSGVRAEYDTDDTYRAMMRALVAGDFESWSFAGQVGVHVRPLDDTPVPGSPQGSELVFGIAGGKRFGDPNIGALTVGPEIFGATALRAAFESSDTEIEGLLSGRFEMPLDRRYLRLKLGLGAGLDPRFGAPEWRTVFAVELFSRSNPDCP